jgi:glyoxylase I family protein
MILDVHHAGLSTGNLERLLGFYRDILGAKIVFETSWPVGTKMLDDITGLKNSSARVVMLNLNATSLELFEFASPAPEKLDPRRPVCGHGITHICFQVTDIMAEYARLKAAGVEFHCPPQRINENIMATYARDPDGNVIELLEMFEERAAMEVRLTPD